VERIDLIKTRPDVVSANRTETQSSVSLYLADAERSLSKLC